MAATGPSSNPRFAAVFQPRKPIPLTRHGLRSGASNDPGTIQGMNRQAREDGLILCWAAIYGDAGDPRYAAIWAPNPGLVVWNADGVAESPADYQARFDAEVSGWCRPAHVTLDSRKRYLSLFVHDEIGPWVARHGMTSGGYQKEFDKWVPKGYFPICVQGGGSGSATRYAALFVKREDPLPQQFHAVGPTANAAIDSVIHQAMKDSPVWNASLAVVHGKKLVYVRGYSWGEPDLPRLPAHLPRFRIASVSKTVIALAVYQLIAEKKLKLAHKLQDILHLEYAAGRRGAGRRAIPEHHDSPSARAHQRHRRQRLLRRGRHSRRLQGGSAGRQLASAGQRGDVRFLHREPRHGLRPRQGHGLQQLRLLPARPRRGQEAGPGTADRHPAGSPLRSAGRSTASAARRPRSPACPSTRPGTAATTSPWRRASSRIRSRWSPRATGISTSSGWRGAADCPPPPPTWGA